MITTELTYLDQLRQLLGDVGIHLVVLGPGLRGGVNVEPGGRPQVPAVVLARDVDPARTGVGEHHGEPHPARLLGEMSLRLGVLVRAGEAEEEVEDGGRDSPPVLTATLARLESTNVKIADRLVGSGTMLRAGYL